MKDKTQKREESTDTDTIKAIAHMLDDWYTQLGRQFGPLSRPQRRTLRLLQPDKPIRVGDLGEQLGLTTAGITRMLDKLEELGHITRARLPHSDQRQVYVTLTTTGAQALQAADQEFLHRIQATLTALNVNEQMHLASLLQKIGMPETQTSDKN